MLNALRHRNFRLYLSGQFVSLIGTWMQQLATSWMVYRLTSSPLWLGISAFSSTIPVFFFGLFAGVIVDRWNQHRLLIFTQALAALQAIALAALTFSGKITLAELIALNFALGLITCFDMATRQAFVVRMLDDKKDLPNAIALNSSVTNATRLLGPALGGFAIGLLGEGWCFALNALSYIAVLGALFMMRVPRRTQRHAGAKIWSELKAGFAFARHNPSIRAVLVLLSFVSMFGMPYNTLFPALAHNIAAGSADALGVITGTAAAGALLGAVYLTRFSGVPRFGKLIGFSSLLFSGSIVALSFARSYAQTLPCIFVTGLGMILMLASGNTVIQYLVRDEMRGRVMSFFNFALLGVVPFGSLLMGAVAQRVGTEKSLFLNGVICVAGSLFFLQHGSRINAHVAAQ